MPDSRYTKRILA